MNNPSETTVRPLGLLVAAAVKIADGSCLFDGYAALYIGDNGEVYAALGSYATLGLNREQP